MHRLDLIMMPNKLSQYFSTFPAFPEEMEVTEAVEVVMEETELSTYLRFLVDNMRQDE